MRDVTSVKTKVHAMRYKPPPSTKDMKYGTANEKTARELFEVQVKKTVAPNGVFVDLDFPYLAATPGDISFFIQNKLALAYLNSLLFNFRWTYRGRRGRYRRN